MNFFTSSRLRNSMFSANMILKSIYNLLKDIDSKIAKDFEKGCNEYDVQKVNDALTSTFATLLGTKDIYFGLEQYCRKFDLSINFSGCTDAEKIHMIAKNKDKVNRVLDSKL